MYDDPVAWLYAIFGVITDPIPVVAMTIVGIVAKSRWPIFVWAGVLTVLAVALDRFSAAAVVVSQDSQALFREIAEPIGALIVGFAVWSVKKVMLRNRKPAVKRPPTY